MKSKNNVEGFALIEVLLAVVVLAVGLLAGSKMQMLGLSYSQGAMTRSYATIAANDIIDRMRLNVEGVTTGQYDGADTEALPVDPNCLAAGCSAAELAQSDLYIWGRHFRKGDAAGHSSLLPPEAIGTITNNGDIRTVRIEWKDLVHGKAEEDRNIEISVIIQ